MTDTNKTSGADVLAILDRRISECRMREFTDSTIAARDATAETEQARTAVAALIEREAALVVQNLPRRICPVEGWGPGEGETVDIPAITPEKLTEILDRADALAAEVKALRERLNDCVEHMEWSTPQGKAAYDAARASAATGGGNG